MPLQNSQPWPLIKRKYSTPIKNNNLKQFLVEGVSAPDAKFS